MTDSTEKPFATGGLFVPNEFVQRLRDPRPIYHEQFIPFHREPQRTPEVQHIFDKIQFVRDQYDQQQLTPDAYAEALEVFLSELDTQTRKERDEKAAIDKQLYGHGVSFELNLPEGVQETIVHRLRYGIDIGNGDSVTWIPLTYE